MFIEQLQRIQALYGSEPMSYLMTSFGDKSEFEYLKQRTVEELWKGVGMRFYVLGRSGKAF